MKIYKRKLTTDETRKKMMKMVVAIYSDFSIPRRVEKLDVSVPNARPTPSDLFCKMIARIKKREITI